MTMKKMMLGLAAMGFLMFSSAATADETTNVPAWDQVQLAAGDWVKAMASGASKDDLDKKWKAWNFWSAMALRQRVKPVMDDPQCWAPDVVGKQSGRPGLVVFTRDCLGLDPKTILTESVHYIP